jgi:hypothetical protein
MVCLGEPFNSGGGSRVDIFRRPNDTFESEADAFSSARDALPWLVRA